jgi:LysM repeat protein
VDILTSGNMALVAHSGPSGTISTVASSTSSGNGRISVYVVRPGDTLSDIATMFNVSMNTIIWSNDLKNAKDVHPGDTLIILPVSGVEHKVAKGDTLRSLARKYGADAEEIAQYNGLEENAALSVGATVIVPGGVLAPIKPRTPGLPAPTQPYRGGSGLVLDGYFTNPVPGGRLTQGIHGWNGIDFGAPRGTPILAAAEGTVIISRSGGYNGGYGSYVVVTHPNGVQTLYAHMSNTAVTPGMTVSQGQVLGYVGNTGRSTGTHLHFEVRGARNPFAR